MGVAQIMLTRMPVLHTKHFMAFVDVVAGVPWLAAVVAPDGAERSTAGWLPEGRPLPFQSPNFGAFVEIDYV